MSVPLVFPEDEIIRTKQAFRDEVNINSIMAKWARTGVIEHLAGKAPTFGDFTNNTSYQDALNQISEADLSFSRLSAAIRDRMHNNPGELIDFLADEANAEEAVKLGLLVATPTPPHHDDKGKVIPKPEVPAPAAAPAPEPSPEPIPDS